MDVNFYQKKSITWLERFAQLLHKKTGELKKLDSYANKWKNIFEKEIRIEDINFKDALNWIVTLAKLESSKYVILFKDDSFKSNEKIEQDFPKRLKPAMLNIYFREEIEDLYLNIYIADIKIKWIATICHEGDIHLAGTTAFVTKAISLL